ncbi:translation termination factor GTPase eRF3 [Starmerella bacillaris]|uniref:Eukaryotic peptide chain release factor GTP-binding subunit n=1 Tax=Starmerella bacillaris TaxID=1247836 RepID=A0AAV5RH66_STABA|nr:translation termination factor GTPase eRF3 [Starmerella bacillaris]
MSDNLAKDLENKAQIGEAKPKKKFDFSAAAKKSFTPSFGFQAPGAGNAYAYQDFSSYAQPQQGQQPAQPAQPEAPQTMTLEDFKKQKQATNLNIRTGTKKVLSLSKKDDEKPAAKEPVKEEVKEQKKPEAPKETKETKDVKEVKEVKETKETKETKEAKETKETKETKDTKAKTAEEAKVDADAVIKEQEQMDQEVVQDLFGGKELKEHMSIIFMGHVDAGKSTMGGNLLYLTGSVDKRTIDKYEKEALDAGRQGWYLSWVMDTNKEERNEGKTIEVGRAVFETEKRRYTILDAPGHKMYVPSMIGGASQADAGILVISARAGEYETGFEKGGQTREHAVLAKTQGVDRLCVAVNKLDDPTVNWSKERYDECISKVAPFLKALGYTNVLFMPVSGYTGAGLKEPVSKELAPWYDGPTLLEWLDAVPCENRKASAPFMLPVSSKTKDLGTVVEGKIESGTVRKGDQLLMMPNKRPVEVATIINEGEEEITGAMVGEQVKIKLKGIDEEDIQIGFVLTSSKNPIKAVTRFEATVAILDIKNILTAGFSCVMHVHTAVEEVQFVKLLHKLEKGTNRKSKKPPAFAKKGMKVIAELQTESAVCIEEFEKTPQLGRFTLRDQGQTIAIGKVTKIIE